MSRNSLLIRVSMLMLCGTAQHDAGVIEEAEKLWEPMSDLMTFLMPRDVLHSLDRSIIYLHYANESCHYLQNTKARLMT